MKTQNILKLNKGDLIIHSRYGKMKVKKVVYDSHADCFFGVIVSPQTTKGREMLRQDFPFGTNKLEFLEDSPRRIKSKIETF